MLTIRQLQVDYGGQTALKISQPVSFQRGDRIGIIGSNGAGKTTLVKAVLGLIPYQGRIVTELRPEQMAAHMQSNAYVNTMPVKYIMEMILGTRISRNEKLKQLIDFFDFASCLSKKYSALSGGQKQKFTIIMVMLQEAELTFYDEVTSGLDFETRQRLMERLVEWYADREDTLVIVSHYYEELELLADKLLILDQGHVIAYGSREELFQEYCGNAIVIVENSRRNRGLTEGFPVLEAPGHLLALSCRDRKMEEDILSILVEHDINFKRSNSDIEIMSINAIREFYRRRGRMMKKKFCVPMIWYELRNLNGNLMCHFFGVVFPNLMSLLISKASCAQVPADLRPQITTSVMLSMSLVMPMATMFLGYGALYSQEVEQGVPLRMHLFGIRENSLMLAKIAAHFILFTVEILIFAVFHILVMDVQKPAVPSLVCLLVSLYAVALIFLVLSHAIANIFCKFSYTFGIEMSLYFILMVLTGMIGVRTEQLPELLQKIAKTLPMTYISNDFVDFWQGGQYNFMPFIQAFVFMGAAAGIILLFSLWKSGRFQQSRITG